MANHPSAPSGGAYSVPKALTELAIKAAPAPESGQLTLWDGALKHFGLRVSQGGAKTFIVLIGSGRRHTIGRWPILSLQQARTEARKVLGEHALGHRGAIPKRWDDAVQEFVAECEARVRDGTMRLRTLSGYQRLLKKHFPFGRKPMAEIDAPDIGRRLGRMAGTPAERNHALVVAKIFFNWAKVPIRRYVLRNPCEGMAQIKRPSRKRVLMPKELAAVYRTALEGVENEDVFSSIVALLVLTGQRRGEIAALEWEWIDRVDRTITLPDALTKNKTEHTFPYSSSVEDILEKLTIQSHYLFPASRETWREGRKTTFYNGWGKDKDAFQATCGVFNWTLHDLRRTFATHIAALKVPPHIVERLINHKFGAIQNQTDSIVSAVAAVYNRHAYLDEMRSAIDIWENYLAKLVTIKDQLAA
jgi:integrase